MYFNLPFPITFTQNGYRNFFIFYRTAHADCVTEPIKQSLARGFIYGNRAKCHL